MSETIAAPEAKPVDAADLRRLLDGEYREIRERVRNRMGDDRFKPVPGDIDRDEYRELVMKWMKMLADEGETTILFPEKYGGQGNLGGGISAFEMLGHADLSLLVKCGVHFGLFGGALPRPGGARPRRGEPPPRTSAQPPAC